MSKLSKHKARFEEIEEEKEYYKQRMSVRQPMFESKSAKELIKDLYGINEPFAPRPSQPELKHNKKMPLLELPKIKTLQDMISQSSDRGILGEKVYSARAKSV